MLSGCANVISLNVGLALMISDADMVWVGIFIFIVAIINIASTIAPEKGKHA